MCLERLDVPASAPEIVLGTSPCFYADRSSVFSPDGGSTAAQRLQVQAVVAAVQARGRRWEPEVSSLPCSSSGKEATSAFASASGRWANYFNYGEKDFQELVVDVKELGVLEFFSRENTVGNLSGATCRSRATRAIAFGMTRTHIGDSFMTLSRWREIWRSHQQHECDQHGG